MEKLTSRFFRSVEGDRQYDAKEWAEYFDTLIKHGVFGEQLDSFEVVGEGNDRKIIVKTGKVFIKGYFGKLEEEKELDISSCSVGNERIDRVILQLNLDMADEENGRAINLYVKEGEEVEENAEPPELTRDLEVENIYEFSLAQVFIEGGEGFIPEDRPEDERNDEELCGYVRYQAKPAWYPGGEVPLDAWMYVYFPEELTEDEKSDIEDNPDLMEIINNSGLKQTEEDLETLINNHVGARGTDEHDVATTSEAGFMSASDKSELNSAFTDTNDVFVAGTYTGDGSSSKDINLGFTPSAVLVFDKTSYTNVSRRYVGLLVGTNSCISIGGDTFLSRISNGFRVYNDGDDDRTNTSWDDGNPYRYVAFK